MPLDKERLRLAPDPADAVRRLDRLVEVGLRPDDLTPDGVEVLTIACCQAPYLATLAVTDPSRLRAAADDPYLRREKPAERITAELAAALDGTTDADDLGRRLRAYRAREYVRLGARECGLGLPEEVGRELAHLADATCDAAITFHDADRLGGLALFGMGKLGGEELNFASDIDVIFVCASDDAHDAYEKLARRVTRTIGELTEDGVVFRVDLRLRPEGSRGPIVNSIAAMERYYESWGRPWERQAWLKARPSAGSPDVAAETLAVLAPFIYPRTVGPNVVRDVEELNRRIKAELARDGGFDVKIGRGGIREIEFFVQALQLVHAGKNPSLRERSTRGALDRLLFAGLVAEREARALRDAYDFLRQVEHRIQLEAGRQTHQLPDDVGALDVLARRLGFGGTAELVGTLALKTDAVAAIFATLGEPPGHARPETTLVIAGATDDIQQAALERLGFRDVEAAAFQLDLLRRRPDSPFGAAATGAAARVAPALLEEIAASPDPDQALRTLVDLRAGEGFWHLLDEDRPLLRLVASLFGTSAFLSRTFVLHPDLIDTLVLQPARTAAERIAARTAIGPDPDEERDWNALRRVKSEELLRIGVRDIAGSLDLEEVGEELTRLADACLRHTFALVSAKLARRGPVPRVAVLGLGKLGGRELGYASDLDLVFVYDGGVDEHETATKLAQRLVHALGAVLEEGRLYEIDTRLRPSGQKGTLVSSLSGWRAYHAGAARPWERQALLRLRAVAGDPELGAAVEEDAARFAYDTDATPAAVAQAIDDMRGRIERELAADQDFKTGAGGLLDVEFAAQYLQLAHRLRGRATIPALDDAARAGFLDEETHATLVSGYRFLRLVENRLRIVHDRPIHEFPRDAVELDKLARRTGYPSGIALERAYTTWTRDVRAAYQRLLRH